MNDPGRASLLQAVGIESGGCAAIIGAGGKTTMMLALARDAADAGLKVIVTTTTKIRPLEDIELVLFSDFEAERCALRCVSDTLEHSCVVSVGDQLGSTGKLHGIAPDLVCRLSQHLPGVLILAEADGAARRSLKVHGAGEPVVPACSELLFVVAGLDAVGVPADESTVHRIEPMLNLLNLALGDMISPLLVARSLVAASRFAPLPARIVYVLNKADSPGRIDAAEAVAAELRKLDPGCTVIATSHGAPIQLRLERLAKTVG